MTRSEKCVSVNCNSEAIDCPEGWKDGNDVIVHEYCEYHEKRIHAGMEVQK